jgi:hypothetical protein
VFLALGFLSFAACGHDVSTGRRCGPGAASCANDASRGGDGDASGTSGHGTPGSSDNALRVHVEDVARMTIEVVTVKCAGECVDVEAVAHGGNPPYAFSWQDGESGAQRRLCPKASTTYAVQATDTAIDVDEFHYAAHSASAQVSASVLDCGGGGGKPGAPCEARAAAGSFDPVTKWTWSAAQSYVTPLVGNLTDDNADGAIDARDTPDVVLVTTSGFLVVLDGATGAEHFRIEGVHQGATPALGDLDGDGRTDIVLVAAQSASVLGMLSSPMLAAYRSDQRLLWQAPLPDAAGESVEVALADLDHDGHPEVIAHDAVFDAQGKPLWSAAPADIGVYTSPTAADLDDDGYLEVIWGAVAMRHDGTPYYRNSDVLARVSTGGFMGAGSAFCAIGDLDGDGAPEIVVSTTDTLFVLDHAGNTLRSLPLTAYILAFPPALHDLDGDGLPEILLSNGKQYNAYDGELKLRWAAPIADNSGISAGTAFDFLGDGTAEAMYGDENTSWGFDGSDGHVIFMQPRQSGTLIEYPSVADVDADGSADILITSSSNPLSGTASTPGLQVISDRMGRWIPARRVLNQETYHVTNVNDDGSIPAHEQPHWRLNDSFRAQAQVNPDGAVCLPRP